MSYQELTHEDRTATEQPLDDTAKIRMLEDKVQLLELELQHAKDYAKSLSNEKLELIDITTKRVLYLHPDGTYSTTIEASQLDTEPTFITMFDSYLVKTKELSCKLNSEGHLDTVDILN